MSFLIAAPELVAAAATDLARVGSTISTANVAASGPTTSVIAAGADEVSAGIAALFGAHAQAYQVDIDTITSTYQYRRWYGTTGSMDKSWHRAPLGSRSRVGRTRADSSSATWAADLVNLQQEVSTASW